ncbi:hypothetical protein JOC95_002804 [Bacillus tianshenii]|uniref:Uncharacterized protein n=1 Tax=Sutcliffiella tianshenii TaxID=1463404 RepID=A0ABS2P244_9BACI|nr:hypothetical protein [Bacillus tianshenii]MBM7620949.1 hypothetical protein [Bacillus tianshenii]
MLSIRFLDWRKNRQRKLYDKLHEMRAFELIFSTKLAELGVQLGQFESIVVYCFADSNKELTFDESHAAGEIKILVAYDFMNFLELDSDQVRFDAFSDLVKAYIVPALGVYSKFSAAEILSCVEEALSEIVRRNYEIVFLVDKTPRKSPNRKKMAILRGIHRSEGFQLRCEIYNDKGLKIIDQLLVEEVGNEIVYARFLGNLKWVNDNLIVVSSKTSSWKEEIEVR